jgi:nucleotide-binding universal stress UspA family protein
MLRGDPAAEIVAEAERERCDLIVMGTHGRTGIRRLLMGSVAEGVVRKATCPVLTYKVPRVQWAKHRKVASAAAC